MTKTPALYDQIEALSEPRDQSTSRNASETSEHTVTGANGTVLSTTKYKRTRRKTEPDFIKLYIADVARLFGCQPRVLSALAKRMEYQSNIVALTPRIREIVSRECGFKNTRSLKNALSKLTSNGLIKKIGQNEYMIDPKVFGRGTWEKIEHAREVYESIKGITFDEAKARNDLDAHFEMGEDREADKATQEDFLEQCKLNENLAHDPYHIPFD